MWTAIMIIALNGQPQEIRGAQSVSESACGRALYSWWLAVAVERPAPVVLDLKCVLIEAKASR